MPKPESESDALAALGRLADEEVQFAQDLNLTERKPPPLDKDLTAHKDWYLKQEYRAAAGYLTLQRNFAIALFVLVAVWLTTVIVAVFMAGFRLGGFALDKAVLITFISSTTASVLGLFLVVARWLFGVKCKEK